MAAGDYRMGLDGVFNYGTAGSTASTEADNVRSCTLNLTGRSAEAVRRGKAWVANKVYILEATVSFQIYDIEGDAFFSALQTAFFGKSRIAAYPTDASSGEGLDADFYVTSFTRNEDNEDFITYDVELKPTDEARDPAWS